jgi:WD40 repeat protein
MSFFSYDSNIIACASKDGSIIVRGIVSPEGDSGDPQEALYLRSQVPDPCGLPKVAWHPATAQILAAAASNKLCIFEIPSEPVTEGDPALDAEAGLELPLPSPSASVTALAFSTNGQLLAAADTTGSIHVWHLEDDADPTFPDRPRMSFVPFGADNAPASLTCLYQPAATPADCVLLAGDATNCNLSIWSISCPVGSSSSSHRCLQTITLNSSTGERERVEALHEGTCT